MQSSGTYASTDFASSGAVRSGVPVDPHLALVGLDRTGQDSEQGGLAAVGFTAHGHASRTGAIAHSLKDNALVVTFAKILELKHGVQILSDEDLPRDGGADCDQLRAGQHGLRES
jgi:hypothetical protein